MSTQIHFDARAVRPAVRMQRSQGGRSEGAMETVGGVVVSFDSNHVPSRAEVIETAAVVTITLFDDRTAKRQRFSRYNHHEVFVRLVGPLSCRVVIDGSYAHAPQAVAAA